MLTESIKPAARSPVGAHIRDTLLFATCYVVLDWTSYLYPLGPFNITPWNPAPALSIIWMMLGGLRYAPLIYGTIFVSDVIIRHAPGGIVFSAITSLVLASGYAAMAAALSHFLKSDYRLSDTRQVWIFVAVTAIGSAIMAIVYVGVLWANDFVLDEVFSAAAFRFWLGDAVGVLVTAPLLLLAADPASRERLRNSWRRPETFYQFAVMIATVVFVFEAAGNDASKYFYVLFLPLIWIALRSGFAGSLVASAIVQVGVVLGTQGGPLNSLALVELQALVAALSLTGMFLGVMVDERERATEGLKASLRLAAAGEMAGAIAHEINQPLGALSNYGRACQLILARNGDVPYGQLNSTIEKMLVESRRAAEVVSRLRDFFRTGTTRLEHVTVASVLESAQEIGNKLNQAGEIDFRVETHSTERVLLADRLQIELVLRNLIANAFEAMTNVTAEVKGVTISARELEDDKVLFRVSDTGPGLSASARKRMFEPFLTTKRMGMGLGLVICQTIAEAHGGSLNAPHAKHGEFHLILPTVAAHD